MIAIALLLIVLLAVLYFIATWGMPANNLEKDPDTRLVLKITSFNNSNSANGAVICNTSPYYNVHVLNSNDPLLKNGTECRFRILIHPIVHSALTQAEWATPAELVPGTIICINNTDLYSVIVNDTLTLPMRTSDMDYYSFENGMITLSVGADISNETEWEDAWKRKVSIISDSVNVKPTEVTGFSTIVGQIISLNDSRVDGIEPCYTVRILDSNDPAIEPGTNFTLTIFQKMAGYWGMTWATPVELSPGTIIRLNNTNCDKNTTGIGVPNYQKFSDNTIRVYVAADPNDKDAWNNAWRQKILVINNSTKF